MAVKMVPCPNGEVGEVDGLVRSPYSSDSEFFGGRKDIMDDAIPAQRCSYPLTPDDEPLIDDAVVLLPEIGRRLFEAIARHPQVRGFSVPQLKALGFLTYRAPCSLGELAAGLGVAMPTASEAVDRLIERGLVTRSVNPADRRQVVLDLTERARVIGAEVREIRRRQLREAFGQLAPADRPVFVNALTVLVEVLRGEPTRWFDPEVCPALAPTSD